MEFEMRRDFNPSYVGPRDDIVKLIPEGIKKVLDIGCSVGALGESIKRKNDAEVIGIEVHEGMANVAKEKLDRVIVGDVENMNLEDYLAPNYFECLIFADVLEHLREPWTVLKNATKFLGNTGVVLASIPNVRHYTTILRLVLKGYWPYDEEGGIHDKTHLRFFTFRNIREMFQGAGLKIIKVEHNYRIEKPHRLNKYARRLALPVIKDFLAFQYLIVARKTRGKNDEELNPNP